MVKESRGQPADLPFAKVYFGDDSDGTVTFNTRNGTR